MIENKDLIPIVYIAGAGRSGSSIFGEALGMLPGVIHLGEIMGIYDYATDPSGLVMCSCGAPYHQCTFWNPLLTELYGTNWRLLINSFGMLGRLPKTKSLLLQKFLHGSISIKTNYITKIANLLNIALIQTNSRIIIDSSKSIPYAILLAYSGRFNIFQIHLVRDPRAVIYSWRHRPIPVYNEIEQTSLLITRTFPDALKHWVLADMGAFMLRLLGYPYIRIRYEDFVCEPEKTIRLIVQAAQEKGVPLCESDVAMKLLQERKVLMQGHWAGSNPRLKTKRGIIGIESDNAWIDKQFEWERFLLNLILGPWLYFYGYWKGK